MQQHNGRDHALRVTADGKGLACHAGAVPPGTRIQRYYERENEVVGTFSGVAVITPTVTWASRLDRLPESRHLVEPPRHLELARSQLQETSSK